MGGHVEREFKLRIPDEAAWHALLARLGALGGRAAEPELQTNHFFDSAAGALRAARIALRLREERGAFTLALKGPELAPGGTLAARPEEELFLAPAEARAVLAGERCPLAWLAASPLGEAELVRRATAAAAGAPTRRLGSFENERLRVGPLAFPPGSSGPELVLELDRTSFPGGLVERELELELPAGADASGIERGLEALFSGVGLAVESVPSKAARLFRILDARAVENPSALPLDSRSPQAR
jgi:inorganic triphosphatase YgiF